MLIIRLAGLAIIAVILIFAFNLIRGAISIEKEILAEQGIDKGDAGIDEDPEDMEYAEDETGDKE